MLRVQAVCNVGHVQDILGPPPPTQRAVSVLNGWRWHGSSALHDQLTWQGETGSSMWWGWIQLLYPYTGVNQVQSQNDCTEFTSEHNGGANMPLFGVLHILWAKCPTRAAAAQSVGTLEPEGCGSNPWTDQVWSSIWRGSPHGWGALEQGTPRALCV